MTDAPIAPGVGPVLQVCEHAHAVVRVLRRAHPDLQLSERGSYLRVLVPERCTLSAAAVAHELGQPFHLPEDLELIMPSFQGALCFDDGCAVWSSTGQPR